MITIWEFEIREFMNFWRLFSSCCRRIQCAWSWSNEKVSDQFRLYWPMYCESVGLRPQGYKQWLSQHGYQKFAQARQWQTSLWKTSAVSHSNLISFGLSIRRFRLFYFAIPILRFIQHSLSWRLFTVLWPVTGRNHDPAFSNPSSRTSCRFILSLHSVLPLTGGQRSTSSR